MNDFNPPNATDGPHATVELDRNRMLTGRQRIRAAMAHALPDRVPVMSQLALGHYFLNSQAAPLDIWFDSQVFVRTLEEFRERYGFDGILLNLPGRPANWRDFIAAREQHPAGTKITWQNGLETSLPRDDNPHSFLSRGAALPRVDSATVDPDDPATYRTAGYVWNIWHAPSLWDIPAEADLADPATYPEWFAAGLREARRACPHASIHAEVFSPFTHLLELFGYEDGLLALVEAPETCHRLLEKFTAIVSAQVRCLARHEPDAILNSSAFAGAGFISPEMYRQFVLPYEKQLAQNIHCAGIPAYVHTCGAIGDRLQLMSETGVDGLDTMDPPPLGTVDLAEVKAQYGDRFFLKGNLDAVNEMLRADNETFERAVMDRLQIGMPGSGYILSSACSVAPHVKPERLRRMVQLAEEFGRYPQPRND